MLKKSLLCAALLACLAGAASAQNQNGPLNQNSPSPHGHDDDPAFGSPVEELKHRAAIRHGEALHKEMVERAGEAAQLATEVRSFVEKNRALGRDELKKLERIEKIARKIRSDAGGSDDDEEVKDLPATLDAAAALLAELSQRLNKSVEKTSRLVVSVSAIEQSNEIIELIRHIRSFAQQ